ncbi:hypothetical protein L1987_77912 [Smallanthus sonchifolius]|uniref:Uncharacterized protein n=1 Tax=Smallanthus sonchifolius TaxID=185202 RepID=A0ACB8ZBE8_9ASTR|nr:hypothetical protein L1987_77912 [Smallanthus sonchifolius]
MPFFAMLLGKEFAIKKVVKFNAIALVLLKYNAALSPAVLSRSDVVYVMINDPDDTTDSHIASHILPSLKRQRVAYRMTVKTVGGTNQLLEEMAT